MDLSSLTKEGLYLTVINNYLMTNYKEDTAQYNSPVIMNQVWTLEILPQKEK